MPARTIATLLLLASAGTAQIQLRSFLNDLPGDVYDTSLSPQGDRIALTWCRGVAPTYSCGVYLRQSSGGEPQLLFNDGEPFELPSQLSWSPDGKWLAYTDVISHNSARLFVRPVAGGKAKFVADVCGGGYSWTPDSRALIVTASARPDPFAANCGLVSYSLDGKRISLVGRSGFHPAVSPDGAMVAFLRGTQVLVRELTPSHQPRGTERVLVTEETNLNGPVWIEGGAELLYATQHRNPLRRISIAPGARPQITPGIDDQTEIISLKASGAGAILVDIYQHGAALWRMDLRAPRRRFEKLQSIPHFDSGHSISDDGRRLVLVSRGGLWTSELDGSNIHLVTRHSEVIFNPRWSPDGRTIAFSGLPSKGNADLRARLYIVAAAGGTPRRLLSGIDNVSFSNWSRDGKWLYVSRQNLDLESNTKPQLWKVNATSETLIQITKSGGYRGDESADGAWLYYTISPYPTLHRVPVSGGTESQLTDAVLSAAFGGAFAVGKRAILFSPDSRDYSEVLKLDLASGVVTTIAEPGFIPVTLQLSADESHLYAASKPAAKRSRVLLEGIH